MHYGCASFFDDFRPNSNIYAILTSIKIFVKNLRQLGMIIYFQNNQLSQLYLLLYVA
jgi:hypothetical protein